MASNGGPVPSTLKNPTSSHFHTLDREKAFSHPSSVSSKYPAAQALVAPHIQSFDALFEGAPTGFKGQVAPNEGLLDLAIKDLPSKVIFDNTGPEGTRGNRVESKSNIESHPKDSQSFRSRLC